MSKPTITRASPRMSASLGSSLCTTRISAARLRPSSTKSILLLMLAMPAWAGFCSSDPSPSQPRHDFEFFAGYSPVSATLIGTTTDRRFVLAGFGYSYRCWVWPNVSISYSGELLPAAVLLQPGQYLPQFAPAHAVYGFAVTPLGFTADFGRRRRVHPFVQTNEGIIASSEPVPINV